METGTTAELRAAKRRRRTVRAAGANQWKIAGCIFALSQPDVKPAMTYIRKRATAFDEQEGEIAEKLKIGYPQPRGTGALERILSPTTRGGQRRLKAATKFMKEWRLYDWIEQINLQQGIAPCSTIICRELAQEGIESNTIPACQPRRHKHRSRIQWLRRWRSRWDVVMGKIYPGERMSSACAQEKATQGGSKFATWPRPDCKNRNRNETKREAT